ncbi:MAG: sialidase family protein [Sphaerochaetaceae bacterium]
MRRFIGFFLLLTLLSGVVFSGEVSALRLNASLEANNNLGLAKTSDALLLAFQGTDNSFYLNRRAKEGQWNTQRLAEGNFNQIVAQGDLVVIGYERSRQPFIMVSDDGGLSFERPIALTGLGQDATIQGLAIDQEGTIHVVFHRHNRYWDYNYSRSRDKGKTFKTSLGFTRNSDSNSTGYSSRLVSSGGNLYTLYQDNNDNFTIKLGLSQDGGQQWQIKRLIATTGGRLALTLDREDPSLAYLAAINSEGLSIFKIKGASGNNPIIWPLFVDESVKPPEKGHIQVHMVAGEENLLAVTYLNPATRSYELLTTRNRGGSWQKESLGEGPAAAAQEYKSSLLAVDSALYFVHFNAEGSVVFHSISSSVPQYQGDEMGFILMGELKEEFEIINRDEIIWLFFTARETGNHQFTHLSNADFTSYILLYNMSDDSQSELAENFINFDFADSFLAPLEAGSEYLMVITPFVDISDSATMRFKVELVAPQV